MKLTEAADIIGKEAKKAEALALVAPVLAQLGSLDQAVAEAERRARDARAMAADAEKELDTMRKAVADAAGEARSKVEEAKRAAEEIHTTAAREADEIRAKATEDVKAILNGAMLAKAEVLSLIAQRTEELAQLETALKEKTALFLNLDRQINKLRAKLG